MPMGFRAPDSIAPVELLMLRIVIANVCSLLQEDGSISHTDMFDFFHLTKYGYYKAFEPVHDLASQILQEAYGIKFTKSTDRLCDMDGAV